MAHRVSRGDRGPALGSAPSRGPPPPKPAHCSLGEEPPCRPGDPDELLTQEMERQTSLAARVRGSLPAALEWQTTACLAVWEAGPTKLYSHTSPHVEELPWPPRTPWGSVPGQGATAVPRTLMPRWGVTCMQHAFSCRLCEWGKRWLAGWGPQGKQVHTRHSQALGGASVSPASTEREPWPSLTPNCNDVHELSCVPSIHSALFMVCALECAYRLSEVQTSEHTSL